MDRHSHHHHVHITMEVVDDNPDTIDVHTLQRRVWCINALDRVEALKIIQDLGHEVTETQGGIADRVADAHRG